jgi:phage terminase large subunit-like protein
VPDKKNSLDKIDGIVAAVMGVGLAMQAEEGGSMDEYFQAMAGAV